MHHYRTLACLLTYSGIVASSVAASEQPWQPYIQSPDSRHPSPQHVYHIAGHASTESHGKDLSLHMRSGSHISLDFGVEVGGHVRFNIDSSSSQPVSLAFAESPSFVRPISDDTGALPGEDYDLALNVSTSPGASWYTTPQDSFRGGFRFMTVNALANVTITNITCEVGFAPNMVSLREYSGYFYTPDRDYELLNRVWYAGAYTVQTNIAPQDTGRFLPQVKPGWDYNATIGTGNGPFLVDGAKRDRAIWPGDIGISGTTAFLAFGDAGLEAVHNALATLFYYQDSSTGEFPFAGPDTASFLSNPFQSDTYHAWSLTAMYDYAIFSGDEVWLDKHWANISRGVEYIIERLDPATGLQNQTQLNDWGRQGTGGFNSALNALNYHAITSIAALAHNATQTHAWMAAAERLKGGYNDLLWDAEAYLYRDNGTTHLHSQDGNALAVLYNLTTSASQASAISVALTRNWNAIGPVTPELPDTISPFVSGIEVMAHFRAGQPQHALELMRRLWGYLLDSPLMTGSTIAEGITANGSLYYRSTAGYNYDASYTSLSHGWSTAPVQAMVYEMLGFKLTGLGGKTWTLDPQTAGLRELRGGFRTALGWFEVHIKKLNGGEKMLVNLKTPPSTRGQVAPSSAWNLTRMHALDSPDAVDNGIIHGGEAELVLQ